MSRRPAAMPNLEPRDVSAWRSRFVLLLFAAAAAALLGRAWFLQVFNKDFLANEGSKRFERTLEVPAGRAAIVDRRGEPLALSAPVESVWAVPRALLGDAEKLPLIARLTGRTTAELEDYLAARGERSFVYLARQIPPAQASRVMAVDAEGVFTQREYRRYYPAGELASQLVGFADIDGNGQEGMELAYNEQLQGHSGSRRVIRDRNGRVVEDLAEFTPPQPGEPVTLSIDMRLQYLAYRELKAVVESHDARGGLVLMMDPRTGEVLAMASQPGFNPNNRRGLELSGLRNRGATDTFEPGSTVKPLMIAWALDQGVVTRQTRVATGNGFHKMGRLVIKDAGGYGDLDMGGVLLKSSNIGAAKVGMQLGAEGIWDAYDAFGFGQRAEVGFPGEADGVLNHFTDWGDVATATSAYGYGLAVTALQLARGYAALADDGRLRPISLLKLDAPNPVERQVVSATSALQVRRWLEQVVAPGGTATAAAVKGHAVAGKTGTVRKVTATGYTEDAHLSLFAGMMPTERPQVVTLVVIDEPRKGDYYGGQVAAPVYSRVMHGAARLLQIPPTDLQTPRPDKALTADASKAVRS
ncbi:penicillin-binding protein 2 [bacterium]|nr:penicillin-binding protein 2 [bacterium]